MSKPRSNLSILITTRYASEYLKLCIETLNRYSKLDNEIIIGTDYPSWQTLKYIQENNLPYILTSFGHQCLVWNTLAQYATREYVIIAGDDIVWGPDWDVSLEEITKMGIAIVGDLMLYNPDAENGTLSFGYKDGNIGTFNLEAFLKYGNEHKKDAFTESFVSWPMMVHKDMYFKYGGLTFHSARGHGHDLQLAYRILTNEPGAKHIKSYKSFVYHFGPTGNRDNANICLLSKAYPNGIKICGNCLKSEEGFGTNETSPECIKINRVGYWLCDNCKNTNIKLKKIPPLIDHLNC